ncbi:hypothetical protein ACET3Z_010749 [Daucus carota]
MEKEATKLQYFQEATQTASKDSSRIQPAYPEMGDVFEKYQAIWKQNVRELKDRVEGIEKQRGKLDRKFTMFNQCFLARIYRPIGIEADYNLISPERCQTFNDSVDSIEYRNTSGDKMVEEEKEMALLMFNVKREQLNYYEPDLKDLDIGKSVYTLQTKDDIHGFWEKWNTGDEIKMKFPKKVWKIEFTKNQGIISLGQGWFDFCEDAALKQGDKLILCPCSNRLEEFYSSLGCGNSGVSFLQQTHVLLMSKGRMIPPLLVTKYYEEQL